MVRYGCMDSTGIAGSSLPEGIAPAKELRTKHHEG
jgi:hypothetical protein